MTRQERMKAFEMRLDGKSWSEIGRVLGYSHTAVYGDLRLCIFAQKKPIPCIYPALSEIIAHEYNGSISAFAERCGSSYNAMYSVLSGRTTPKSLGKAICAATGLSYAEAFHHREEG